MKKLLISIIQILPLSGKDVNFLAGKQAMELLIRHQNDLMRLDFFDDVQIESSVITPDFLSMVSIPKSLKDLEEYEKTKRPEMKAWFTKHLTEPGLVRVVHAWVQEVSMD